MMPRTRFERFARDRRDFWSLSGSNGIRTHNHLVRKQILNYLAKLASFYVLSTLSLNQQVHSANDNPKILAVEWS